MDKDKQILLSVSIKYILVAGIVIEVKFILKIHRHFTTSFYPQPSLDVVFHFHKKDTFKTFMFPTS